jgi:glycosyltransferase involved in cell wall biosynthesis
MPTSARPIHVLFLPDYSAANAYQRALAAGLRDLGVEVHADPTRSHRVAPVLEALRGSSRPDVIHVHWTEPYIARGPRVSSLKARRTLLELRLARLAGMRIVWTAHDLFRHDRAEDAAERAFMRSLFDLADAVIVHCSSAADALLATLGVEPTARGGEPAARDKVHVIPHGHYRGAYPDDISREAARARLDLPAAARVVAFTGWVRAYKGVTELVVAFGTLPEPYARLVIAGQAVDAEYAARLTALVDADPRVRLDLGFVPDEELQVYLRAADVIACPFLEIFTSGSVLLAMSFERAIIAPRRGCVTDALDEAGGILYDADDPQGLEGALRVAMHADLASMGRHNGERLERFDWSRVAGATLATYREVGERPRR